MKQQGPPASTGGRPSLNPLEQRCLGKGSSFQKLGDDRADAGIELLEGDLFAIREADAIAIGTMIKPHEDDVFTGADMQRSLQMRRNILESEPRILSLIHI